MRPRMLAALGLATALALHPVGARATDVPADPGPGGDSGSVSPFRAVRDATARYQDVATAEADGYVQASACVPLMGSHYVRSVAASQEELEITQPNILVYESQPDGSLRLVAVEYASATPAVLFGRDFDAPPEDAQPYAHYTLHLWIWEENPAGLFSAGNPRLTC